MLFGKPFSQRSNSAITGKERKRLLSTLPKSATLTSLTANLSCTKIITHSKSQACIYSSTTLPLFFTLDLDSTLFPTIYTLWQCPNLLPTIETMQFAMNKLENGADLMAPGVLGITGTFQKNEVVSVSVNGIPYAVGRAVMSAEDMEEKTTGKVVLILHVFHDLLWESGDKTEGPAQEVKKVEKVKVVEEVAVIEKATLSMDQMDEYLRVSFLTALFDWPEDNAELLPITASVFYSDFVLKSRPDDTLIDLKLTSYKKAMDKLGFIKTRERQKELIILTVDRNAVINSGFTKPKKVKKKEVVSNGELTQPKSKRKISVENVYKPDSNYFRAVLEGMNSDPSRLLTSSMFNYSEIKGIVGEYIKKYNLVMPENKRMIALDSVLIKCIKTDDIYLSHRDLIDGIIAGKSLSAHHTITFADLGAEKRTVSHKGAVVPILVSVRNRGSKVTTLISNLDRFEIDAKLFSQECKIKLACATSIVEEHGQPAVMIQGSQTAGVGRVLSEGFGVEVKFNGKEWTSEMCEVKIQKGIKKK